jgi:hypothetical protein
VYTGYLSYPCLKRSAYRMHCSIKNLTGFCATDGQEVLVALTVGVFSDQAIKAHYLAHNRAILLFYKTLIVFEIWAAPREGDMYLFAVGITMSLMNSPPLSVSISRIGKGKSVRARLMAARTAS